MTTTPDPAPLGDPADPAQGALAPGVEEAVLREVAELIEGEVEPEEEASMDALDNPRRLVLVHAHPDDETIGTGATMAAYAARGASVTLVTCTLGEEGEILVPDLAHRAADAEDTLGQHRVGELAAAMEALGVTDHRFLGGPGRYRDSGMMGLATNERPDCLWQADLDEAAMLLVAVLREVRPQVLVTYDENGGYGHPDHIKAHRVAMRAVELASEEGVGDGEPWQVEKVYWTALAEREVRDGLRRLAEAGSGFAGLDPDAGLPPGVVPEEQISTAIDGSAHLDAKLAAMRAHATQITVQGRTFALSNDIGFPVWTTEHYRIARGHAVPGGGRWGWEEDLFAGVV